MEPIKLGDTVKIEPNKTAGQVRGIWSSLAGETQYRVLYSDKQGCLREDWLLARDLTVTA